MDPENQLIEINSADEEALTELQGVGARLAKRIIDARPFTDIDDLARVRGISADDVTRLRPFLSVAEGEAEGEDTEEADEPKVADEAEGAEEADIIEEAVMADLTEEAGGKAALVQTVDEADEMEETLDPAESVDDPIVLSTEIDEEPLAEELASVEEAPAKPPAVQPDYMTRGGACSLFFVGAFITLILAIVVTLGILSSINQGQLEYASPAQIAALQSHTEALVTQSQTLAEDIDGLRTRMDNLESLSSQVSDIESELNIMRAEISGLQAQINEDQAEYDNLLMQLEELNAEIEILYTQGERSESFLEGLYALMEELFPPEVEETP